MKNSPRTTLVCSVDGCTRRHNARGLCTTHGERLRRTGTLADPVRLTASDRLLLYTPDGGPTECWEWTGPRTSAGYGQLRANKQHMYAHRFAWEQANQRTIPKGMQVMHSCDNPPCVNPAHLSVGSAWSNALDKVAKGRQHRGASVAAAKLTPAIVKTIRADFRRWRVGRATMSNAAELAARYSVSPATVMHVVKRDTWNWVD